MIDNISQVSMALVFYLYRRGCPWVNKSKQINAIMTSGITYSIQTMLHQLLFDPLLCPSLHLSMIITNKVITPPELMRSHKVWLQQLESCLSVSSSLLLSLANKRKEGMPSDMGCWDVCVYMLPSSLLVGKNIPPEPALISLSLLYCLLVCLPLFSVLSHFLHIFYFPCFSASVHLFPLAIWLLAQIDQTCFSFMLQCEINLFFGINSSLMFYPLVHVH